MLKDFDKTVGKVKGVFEVAYGKELTESMLREAHLEYEQIIPQLPYIGGKQPFTQFVIASGWFLAMYRVLKRYGKSVEEMGRLIYDLSEAYLKAYPGFLRGLLGNMTFSKRYLKRLQQRASESQLQQYPDDYVFSFVPGDGETFDYGVDYTQCATCKFLEKQGAPELAPYVCAVDKIYSELLGWGLRRTMTLAEGYDRCDFRFKKGGETWITRYGGSQSLNDFSCEELPD